MRKNTIWFLLSVFVFGPSLICAQNKYKVEFEGESNGICSPISYGLYLDVANFNPENLNTAQQLFWVNNAGLFDLQMDQIITTENEYLRVRKERANGQENQCATFSPDTDTFLGCITVWGFDQALPDVDVSHFNVYKILPLDQINDVSEMGYCESQPIEVTSGLNTNCYAYYALSIFVDNNEEQEILPYGKHANPYMFNPSEIDGVNDDSLVYFKVYYDEEGTVFSNLLDIDIFPCVPVLDPDVQNNLVGEDVTCPGGEDGGITAVFDRALTEEESMQLTFIMNNDALHDSPLLDGSDFQGNTLYYKNTNEEKQLPAGNYTMQWFVVVGNDYIDGGSAPVTIGEPDPFEIQLDDITNVACEGGNDGEITITASGGSPPYIFNWKRNGDDFALPQGSTDTHLVNLPEGIYTVTLTDSHNCEFGSQEFVVDFENTSPLLDGHQVFQPGIPQNYSPTGSININNIIGGSGNYILHWEKDGDPFQPENPYELNGLESGSYDLTIEDADTGCLTEVEPPIEIVELDPLSVEITETLPISCEGDVGILEANPSGGTNGGYEYLWSTGETTSSINVGQGEYSVTVTDNGDSQVQEVYVFNYVNPLLNVEVNTTDVVCKDEATGSIELDISGGTGGPYTVSWLDTQQDGPVRNDLEAGEYIYFVTDGECQVTNENDPIVIDEPEAFFTVEKFSQVNVSLNGENDGSLEVSLENGSPPYTFHWTKDGQPYEPTAESTETNLVGLEEGIYQVVVTDDLGCQATLETPIQISEPDPLAIVEINTVDVNCKGAFTGSITANVTGIAPFTYTWKKQGDVSFSAPNQKTITGLSAGTYILSVSDNSIVPEVTEVVVVNEPDEELAVTAIPNITECFLGDEGIVQISASGGVAPYQYSINQGMDFQGEPIFDGLESGTYEIVVLDANQCEYQTLVVLGQPDQTNAEFAISSQAVTGETVLAVDLSYPAPDELEWVVPDEAIVLSKNSDELEIVFHQPGEYEVGVLAYRGDCLSTETKKILVLEGEGIAQEPSQGDDTRKKIEYFIIYPNPTTGRFTSAIQLGEPSNISLKIFGLANNNLITQEQAFGNDAYEIPMDISGLPAGLYVVVLETEFGSSVQKIILN